MVDALREARRVLKPSRTLIDVRPILAPMATEILAAQVIWAKDVDASSTPEDVVAAENAMRHALSEEWFAFLNSIPFLFDIYFDTTADLSLHAQSHKWRETDIPYSELDHRLRDLSASGPKPRIRCRRPWMLSSYRKR